MRVGLGCLRIRPDDDATIVAALEAGVRLFDTARAYPGSEEQLGRVLRARAGSGGDEAFVVTKCGMMRDGPAWIADGRASAIIEDARASRAALGRAADLLLLHAPDPRVPLSTSMRALVRAKDEGLARAIGVSNVGRRELEEAARESDGVAGVEVALGAFDDEAARSGVIAWCAAHDARLFAYGPLGGPKRAPRLARDPVLRVVAKRHGVEPAVIVLAYLLRVHPKIEPLVGASRPESIRRALESERLVLSDADLELLDARFPSLGAVRCPPRAPNASGDREVVIVMGLAGAGKSRLAEGFVARGYERLNRDTLGGTLRGIAKRLDERLGAGASRVVLDNTYVTRASRADVVRIAHARGAAVRCVFMDTSLADAQVNVITRMLGKYGELLGPEEMKRAAKKDPNTLAPTALFRMARELEPPADDEGFAAIETVAFTREEPPGRRAGVAVPFEAIRENGLVVALPADTPVLVFGWRPPSDAARVVADLAADTGRVVDFVACHHGEGPPVCWCRPPLPGAWLWFAHRRNVGREGSVLLATTPAHRKLAATVGIRALDA